MFKVAATELSPELFTILDVTQHRLAVTNVSYSLSIPFSRDKHLKTFEDGTDMLSKNTGN
jgi:hypothetical protein